MYRLERNTCSCHPETCNCDPWAIYDDKGKFTTIYQKEKAVAIVNALNEKGSAVEHEQANFCSNCGIFLCPEQTLFCLKCSQDSPVG